MIKHTRIFLHLCLMSALSCNAQSNSQIKRVSEEAHRRDLSLTPTLLLSTTREDFSIGASVGGL